MRIALVSYEYPPDTATGGIATYTCQWARLLFLRGYDVEVFCASVSRTESIVEDGILVHRVNEADRMLFKKTILPVFSERHRLKKFNLIESPEFNADGKLIKQTYPEVKLVVKLHAPSFIVNRINLVPRLSTIQKFRVVAGALRRLQIPSFYWREKELLNDEEKIITKSADLILVPSGALKQIVSKKWGIEASRIHHLPNPFIPDQSYLNIPAAYNDFVVTFIGRLDKLKGVLSFIDIIPIVAAKIPNVMFRFVGADSYIHEFKSQASIILLTKLHSFHNHIEFTGAVSIDEIPSYLSDTSICVFPSLWENFPTVCLEAMSAGRAVVGGKYGGMHEMLAYPKAGILVDPADVNEIADAICQLLENAAARDELGAQGRKNVLERYNGEAIGSMFEKLVQKLYG